MEPKTELKIRELVEFAKVNNLAEVTYQENGLRVSFRRASKSARSSVAKSSPPADTEQVNGESPTSTPDQIIRSPIVGTFRRSQSKDHPPLVLEGGQVKPGERLGVVECMKIPNEVVSFSEGIINKIMVEDGQVVEYGQPLFLIAAKTPAPVAGR